MKRINIDLDDLQVFLALADVKNFRATAREVGLSGPALSRLIARTEDRLGTRLFDRDTRNVQLTPQGEALRRIAERLLSETHGALDSFRGFLNADRGRVVLAGLPSVTAGLLPPVIARFSQQRPDVEIHVKDALSDSVAAAVLDGRADLGFTAGITGGDEKLSFRPLLADRFVAIAGPGFLDEDRPYTWEELVAHPFIAMSQGTSVRALTEAAMTQCGLLLRPRFEVSHLATAGALVAEGLGVSALPHLTLPVLGTAVVGAANTPPLTVRPLQAPVMIRRIGLVRAAGATLSPAAQAFYDLVCAQKFGTLSVAD